VQKLNFPTYRFRLKNSENKTHIFDEIRKKFVVLTPEEWVRQNCLHFLKEKKKYPLSLINIEKEFKLNGLKKRYDIVIYDKNKNVHCIVECKAPSIKINQKSFDQIAIYNTVLKSSFLMVTNGLNHYYCKMNSNFDNYIFLDSLPDYKI
tara:strand:- start:2934 stop:3380 length:447 start_codon:yes stop_codon:yes gene_type:complete